jgi:hypothetical protein
METRRRARDNGKDPPPRTSGTSQSRTSAGISEEEQSMDALVRELGAEQARKKQAARGPLQCALSSDAALAGKH